MQTEEYVTVLATLKALRLRIAHENKVPAYVIFTDATLSAMAQQRPETLDQLIQIAGVGAVKMKQYGQRFLRCIKKALADCRTQSSGLSENSTPRDCHRLQKPEGKRAAGKRVTKTEFVQRTLVTELRTCRAWTDEDERQLRALIRVGLSMHQLSEALNRSMDDIAKKLKSLGSK